MTRLKRRIAVRSVKSATRLDPTDIESIAEEVVRRFNSAFEIEADTGQ
jgi:hypothetical protein